MTDLSKALEDLRWRLNVAGGRVQKARETEKAALREVAELVREAKHVLRVSEMAQITGLSRDTIYAMREENE